MYTCGNLEITPNGYGFIRQDHRLPGSRFVYVSPALIRRFQLNNGDYIGGQVRPPNEREQFFSFVTLEEVNGQTPTANFARSINSKREGR